MKHLSKIKSWVWCVFALLLSSLGLTSYFIFTKKIEKYIVVKVQISKTGIDRILMKSQDIFLINKTSKLRLRLKQKYYNVTIEEIEEKDNGEKEITIKEKIPEFSSGLTMEARIIYSTITVWEKIIER